MCLLMPTKHNLLTNGAVLHPADCNHTPVPELYIGEQIHVYVYSSKPEGHHSYTLIYVCLMT